MPRSTSRPAIRGGVSRRSAARTRAVAPGSETGGRDEPPDPSRAMGAAAPAVPAATGEPAPDAAPGSGGAAPGLPAADPSAPAAPGSATAPGAAQALPLAMLHDV